MAAGTIKLTDEQIAQLFKFVEKKFVRQYDVQVELVDHLASQIEELMSTGSVTSFDVALGKVYAGFGIFGFHNLSKERFKASYQQGRNFWWTEFKALFRWPALLTTFCLGVLLYLVQLWVGSATVGVVGAVSLILASSTLLGMSRSNKPLSALSFSNGTINIFMSSVIQVSLNVFLYFEKINSYPVQFYILFLTVSLSFTALAKVHLRMIKILRVQYPETFQLNSVV